MGYFNWEPKRVDKGYLRDLATNINIGRDRDERAQAAATAKELADKERLRQELKDTEYARQNDLNERREKARAEREFDQMARQNAATDAQEAGALPELFAKGGDTAIEARMNARRWTDHAGVEHGPRYTRGTGEVAEPMETEKLDEPFQPPPLAAASALSPGKLTAPEGAPDPMSPEAKASHLPEHLARYSQDVQREMAGRPKITFENGTETTLDPGERNKYLQTQRNEQADAWLTNVAAKTSGSPAEIKAAQVTAEAIRSHVPVTQAAAYYLSTLQQLQSQGFKGEEGAKDRAAAEQRARIHAGRPRGPGKVAPDLSVEGPQGVPYTGKTLKETEELREQKKALDGGIKVADELIADLQTNKKLIPIVDSDKQAYRKQLINRMLEAKKNVTGALNASDVERAESIFNTGIFRGPEGVTKAIEAWKDSLQFDYYAGVKSKAKPRDGAPVAPAAAKPGHNADVANKIIEDLKNGR